MSNTESFDNNSYISDDQYDHNSSFEKEYEYYLQEYVEIKNFLFFLNFEWKLNGLFCLVYHRKLYVV